MNNFIDNYRISRLTVLFTFTLLFFIIPPTIWVAVFCFFMFWKFFFVRTFVPNAIRIYVRSLRSTNTYLVMARLNPSLRCKALLLILLYVGKLNSLYQKDQDELVVKIKHHSNYAFFVYPIILYAFWELNKLDKELNYEK